MCLCRRDTHRSSSSWSSTSFSRESPIPLVSYLQYRAHNKESASLHQVESEITTGFNIKFVVNLSLWHFHMYVHQCASEIWSAQFQWRGTITLQHTKTSCPIVCLCEQLQATPILTGTVAQRLSLKLIPRLFTIYYADCSSIQSIMYKVCVCVCIVYIYSGFRQHLTTSECSWDASSWLIHHEI